MELSSRESIRFFRLWDQPRTMLAWEDVKTRCPSWKSLRQDYSFTREKLFSLQPDKVEWIKRGALTLHDMTNMSHFPINPISDLHADLTEVWSMHLTKSFVYYSECCTTHNRVLVPECLLSAERLSILFLSVIL